MQILVVSAPGAGRDLHWSAACARDVAALAVADGGAARWLCALPADCRAPDAPAGVDLELFRHARLPVSKVARSQLDISLERSMTTHLRRDPTTVVLQVGLGARGTPNALWLAGRMGSRTHGYLRGPELVCHRGDLVERDGRACGDWSDPERCRRCCATGWLSRPRADDFRNRVDLLFASLATCASILVPAAQDVDYVTGLGLDARRVAVAGDAAALYRAVRAGG